MPSREASRGVATEPTVRVASFMGDCADESPGGRAVQAGHGWNESALKNGRAKDCLDSRDGSSLGNLF